MKAEPVEFDDGSRTHLGESPRWDGQAWWWVDAAVGQVWRRVPGEAAQLIWRTGERTSLVHPEAADGVVVARDTQLWVVRRSVDEAWWPRLWCDLRLPDGWLVNDGVADALGRLWIGSIAPSGARHAGSLLRIEPDGSVDEAATGFTMTNGMTWDTSGTRLFHVDTAERIVWLHHVDPACGAVEKSEIYLQMDDDGGLPDGLATDQDDGVWVAIYGAGQVRRYDGAGRLDTTIDVATSQTTSAEIGGPDGKDVLITTAREGYDEERSAQEPLAGRLFRARTTHGEQPRFVVRVSEET